jgi:SOS-response transcriptional repressor LexA
MTQPRRKSRAPISQEWASAVSALRHTFKLSQTSFGKKFHSSAMAVSRWERGAQEPSARSYIELGNFAGDPQCWYFWARAGLRPEDLMQVVPQLRRRLSQNKLPNIEVVRAGSGDKKPAVDKLQLIAIPLLKVVAASLGQKGDNVPLLHGAPVENMIAAPKDWCPNPATTSCLRVKGSSMNPLIGDGYILAVDSSQSDHGDLNGKIVIAWHKDIGLTVSRFRQYDHTEVLHPENPRYESVTLDAKNKWKILAKVLWWIGKDNDPCRAKLIFGPTFRHLSARLPVRCNIGSGIGGRAPWSGSR